MRISIPRIDYVPSLPPALQVSVDEAATRLARFLEDGTSSSGSDPSAGNGTLILCGAGVSVDSGIRAYRGRGGSYNVNRTYRPIFFHEFVAHESFRQRYWARSYLGYPPVQKAKANKTHFSIAALQYLGYLTPGIITQNVDRLQHKAVPNDDLASTSILELHGSLKHAHCLSCGLKIDRDVVQKTLSELNPIWWEYLHDNIRNGTEPRTNPDGDVDLQGRSYDSFKTMPCPKCSGIVKPSVVFFGENISAADKSRAQNMIDSASRVLLMGTSLATYSAYRLLKQATDANKPVAMLNVGTSRGDDLIPHDLRFSLGSSDVLPRVVALLSDGKERQDIELNRLMGSGVLEPVRDDRKETDSADTRQEQHVVNPQ